MNYSYREANPFFVQEKMKEKEEREARFPSVYRDNAEWRDVSDWIYLSPPLRGGHNISTEKKFTFRLSYSRFCFRQSRPRQSRNRRGSFPSKGRRSRISSLAEFPPPSSVLPFALLLPGQKNRNIFYKIPLRRCVSANLPSPFVIPTETVLSVVIFAKQQGIKSGGIANIEEHLVLVLRVFQIFREISRSVLGWRETQRERERKLKRKV